MSLVTPTEIRAIGRSAISTISDTDLEALIPFAESYVQTKLQYILPDPVDTEIKMAIIYYVLLMIFSEGPSDSDFSLQGIKGKLGKFEFDTSSSYINRRDPAKLYLRRFNEIINAILQKRVRSKRATTNINEVFEAMDDQVEDIHGYGSGTG